MPDDHAVMLPATWWTNARFEEDIGESENAELQLSYDGSDAFYIDGLRPGYFLSIEVQELMRALVASNDAFGEHLRREAQRAQAELAQPRTHSLAD